jgi:hypothetical protein
MNVNSLEEVPNSSWYTNRMAIGRMTRQEVEQGPSVKDGSPEFGFPWKVTGVGMSGAYRYLRITDSGNQDFTLRFGGSESHEAGTASYVIASRLMYAAGYNVPECYIVHFRPEDLTFDSIPGQPHKGMTSEAVDSFLATVTQTEDGRFRALAVRDFDGVDCGVFPFTGTRDDDPNDLIPHEHRRELRALKVFCAWLGHVDFTPDNGVDIYVEEEGRSYIKHYLRGFSDCFGTYFLDNTHTHPGFEHRALDMKEVASDLLTSGLTLDAWERLDRPSYAFSGPYYEAELFDIDNWKPIHPVPCFLQMTPQDAFWAAKIISVFGDEHLGGAVSEAKISLMSQQYLLDVLKKRRMQIIDWAYSNVNPLDGFKLEFKRQGLALSFINLAERYTVVSRADIEYHFRILDRDYRSLLELRKKPMHEYVLPHRGFQLPDEDTYLIVEIRTINTVESKTSPAARAHFYGGRQRGFALIGVERDS